MNTNTRVRPQPFEQYSNTEIIRSSLVQTIQKLSRQSGSCPDNPETVTQSRNCPYNPETVRTIQKQSGQSRICPDNPKTEFLQLAYNTEFKHFLSVKSLKILDFTHIWHKFVDVAIYAHYPESFAGQILLSGIFFF